ncbi:HPr family phosphocarrier protein [Brooklawnia cerclae]|uniref:Phosphocarrier protein HPr n=1 Tax=Brooklawnia cerclae TaxID=349934 RepID=A0ABX0SJ43_9ACTN|nr:HPr family phosphocarrier protein [Brooklawnia cerclae]NIH58427.1 phosphocarrier protein [Brooklawnia cerclae]
MSTREATIAAAEGLHARPASLFVQAAKAAGIPVTISKDGKGPVSATSILSVLSLGAKKGDVVVLAAEGDGADAALDTLVAELEKDEK